MSALTSCASCGHAVDPAAKLCLYCGANPSTGERIVDAQAMLHEVFTPKSLTRSETVIEYARQRQTAVVAIALIAGFLVLAALHQFVTVRNERDAAASTAVPLTEVTDVSARSTEAPLPLPDLDFQYDGQPRVMQTFIVEPGAVPPPAPVAAPVVAGSRPAGPPPNSPNLARPNAPRPNATRPQIPPPPR